MKEGNEMEENLRKENKTLIIVIMILVLIVGFFIGYFASATVFNKSSEKEDNKTFIFRDETAVFKKVESASAVPPAGAQY